MRPGGPGHTLPTVPTASLTLSGQLAAVGDARRFVQSTLAGWDVDSYDIGAPVVVTELATNAALHARTSYEVTVTLASTYLVVEVSDGNPRRPQPREYEVEATTGRGIALVDALCLRWGVTPGERGKVVWALLRPDESLMLTIEADDVDDAAPSHGAFRAGTAGGPAAGCRNTTAVRVAA